MVPIASNTFWFTSWVFMVGDTSHLNVLFVEIPVRVSELRLSTLFYSTLVSFHSLKGYRLRENLLETRNYFHWCFLKGQVQPQAMRIPYVSECICIYQSTV